MAMETNSWEETIQDRVRVDILRIGEHAYGTCVLFNEQGNGTSGIYYERVEFLFGRRRRRRE